MKLHGKRALVMGLGIHGGGLGVARFLAEQGAAVTVTDLRSAEMLAPSLAALAGLPIRFVLGEHREDDFRSAEIVVRNPGVPRESRFLQIARAAGAAIEMEMTLFFRLCPAPILAITGTKGKTTTTLLTAAMVAAHFPGAIAAGNLRVSALEQLPLLSPQTPIILELSSFALEGLGEAQISPPFAAITNFSADHLDRYGSLDSYADAKRQIYAWQARDSIVALNAADPGTHAYFAPPTERIIWFAGQLADANRGIRAVGWQGEQLMYRTETQAEVLLEHADVRLIGRHNLINIAAAAALACSFGIPAVAIRAAVREFQGVEHRLEPIRTVGGITYVNDTAATAPEAAIAAIESFDRPIVLIAGGSDKNLPFEKLAEIIAARVKAVVLLQGSATAKLLAELPTSLNISGPYESLELAMQQAQQLAATGDIVLLSPGCASFGMFRNEFHRGEEFRRIVHAL
jgi:UDP-N-acetylmuramoylalanine--D-glutamate ligase